MGRPLPRFHHIIGQRPIVAQLQRLLAGARERKEPFPHSLFIGPSGVGKTLLSRALAAEYGTTCKVCYGDVDPEDLASKFAALRFEILPDGTIVSGHQRLRAVKLLGWTEVTVVVRFDLQEAGPAAAEAYFLEANEIRRQLGQLEHLAVIVRRHELEPKGSQRRGQGEIREIIGAKLGMTGRHVSRMIKLLALPLAIRNAVDDQRITLKDAERCLDLDSQQLERVRHALERGGGVAEIIAESLASTTQTSPASFKIANSIRKQLLRCGRQLARNIAAVAESCGHRDVKALAQIETAVRRLRQRLIGAGQ